MILVADPIELERRPYPGDGGRPQGAMWGAHHDAAILQGEIHRSHRRNRLTGHRDPAHPTTLEQTHAVSPAQNREASGVPLSTNLHDIPSAITWRRARPDDGRRRTRARHFSNCDNTAAFAARPGDTSASTTYPSTGDRESKHAGLDWRPPSSRSARRSPRPDEQQQRSASQRRSRAAGADSARSPCAAAAWPYRTATADCRYQRVSAERRPRPDGWATSQALTRMDVRVAPPPGVEGDTSTDGRDDVPTSARETRDPASATRRQPLTQRPGITTNRAPTASLWPD